MSTYALTPAGLALRQVIDAFGEWAAEWALGDPRPDELDAGLLLWRMRRRVNHDRLPPRRVVVQFDFRGVRSETYWLILEPTDASVCLHEPGFEVDVRVSADVSVFHRVWLGRMSLSEALRTEAVQLEGSRNLTRSFGSWFAWSPYAATVRRVRRDAVSAFR